MIRNAQNTKTSERRRKNESNVLKEVKKHYKAKKIRRLDLTKEQETRRRLSLSSSLFVIDWKNYLSNLVSINQMEKTT